MKKYVSPMIRLRLPLLMVMLLCAHFTGAEVVVGNLCYSLNQEANTASVVGHSNEIEGELLIPAEILYDGVAYSVISLGDYAFLNCQSFTSVTVPNSVTSIGEGVFAGCHSLESINIPNSVTEIGAIAFSECFALTSVIIPNSVTRIGGYAFSGCSSLTSVDIPNSITKISDGIFCYCSALASVSIPGSVTYIDRYAFFFCDALVSVTIPEFVNEIGAYAFYECSSLTSVYCDRKMPPVAEEKTFKGVYGNATLYVPEESVALYQTTEPWNLFSSTQADTSTLYPITINDMSVNVSTDGCDIVVTMPEGMIAEVYDMSGRLATVSTEELICGLSRGIYIVRVGSDAVKVSL